MALAKKQYSQIGRRVTFLPASEIADLQNFIFVKYSTLKTPVYWIITPQIVRCYDLFSVCYLPICQLVS